MSWCPFSKLSQCMHETSQHRVDNPTLATNQEVHSEPRVRDEFLTKSTHELIAYIREQFPEVTDDIWNQLKILDQPAIEITLRRQAGELPQAQPNEAAQTHLSYELEMVRIALAYQDDIQEFVFGDRLDPIEFGTFSLSPKDLTRRLVFMILFSDVGKAGSELLQPGKSSTILQMYTHVIMDTERHGKWLRGRSPESLPLELTPALEYIYSQPVLDQQVFAGGNFSLAPISIAMYCAEQVFLETFPNHAEYQSLFQLSQESWNELLMMGMNPDTTLMKDFWTYAHIYCAEIFAESGAVRAEDRNTALLALLHHYSQGARPIGADALNFSDPRAVRILALTEVLDKANANVHRSHQNSVAELSALTENMVMPAITKLNKGNDNAPDVKVYRDTVQFFKVKHLFEAIGTQHNH